MDALLTEIRFALRHLSRSPSFSILVIVTLALDPGVLFAAAPLIVAVTLVASCIPARRASRVDPCTLLRSE